MSPDRPDPDRGPADPTATAAPWPPPANAGPTATWGPPDPPPDGRTASHDPPLLSPAKTHDTAGPPGPGAATASPPTDPALTASLAAGFSQPSDPGLPPPPPGYELLGVLGRGAMGVVYRARQVALNREVALKVILAGRHASAVHRVRFLAEAEAVAALSHPGVVQVFDFGTWDGQPFMALEYLPGGTLADKLAGTPLPSRDAAALVEQLAHAVAAAHARGIVHRDRKPANVLLAADGAPKVADFGLAKMTESGEGLTATVAILGTPSYMAPEQARGDAKTVGMTADVYALGAVLFECLTGRPPLKGTTPRNATWALQSTPSGLPERSAGNCGGVTSR
jgi:serine/threonine-protein kinase